MSKINELKYNKKTSIQVFVYNIRNKPNICFLVVSDLNSELQVTVVKEKTKVDLSVLDKITPQSCLTITGVLIENSNVKNGGREFIPDSIVIESLAASPLPLDTTSLLDQRLDNRWLDLRSKKNQLIFKVGTLLCQSFREFLVKKGFLEIHSPKLIAAASESGSEVFEVSNYFNKKAYLAQSPQFYKQMAIAAGFEKVFEVGPVFRAENSNSSRHCTEFTGFDLEMANVSKKEQVMKMEEDMIKYGLAKVAKKYNAEIKKYYNREVFTTKTKFPVLKLEDAINILETKYNIKVNDKTDLNQEGEKLIGEYIKEKYNSDFVFIVDYPKTNRAFYHYRINNIPDGFDLIYRGIEITTGAKREHRVDVLTKQAEEKGLKKDVEFYLDFFKYGCPPHGGFGLGFDRIIMQIFGLSIKEVEFCFRGPDRLTP